MDQNCIFCRIASGQEVAELIYKDEDIVVFKDIHPQAPIHFLIVPKRHLASVNNMTEDDVTLMGELFLVAKKMALQQNVASTGYKLVINNGETAGQQVPHLHMHFLAGKSFK